MVQFIFKLSVNGYNILVVFVVVFSILLQSYSRFLPASNGKIKSWIWSYVYRTVLSTLNAWRSEVCHDQTKQENEYTHPHTFQTLGDRSRYLYTYVRIYNARTSKHCFQL